MIDTDVELRQKYKSLPSDNIQRSHIIFHQLHHNKNIMKVYSETRILNSETIKANVTT